MCIRDSTTRPYWRSESRKVGRKSGCGKSHQIGNENAQASTNRRALPDGRQSGSNPANISKDPGCCGGQDRQECPCTISVRGSRCCGSGLGDCGLAMRAEVFPVRRCKPGAPRINWVGLPFKLAARNLLAPQLARLSRPHRGPRPFHLHQVLAPVRTLAPASQVNFSSSPLDVTAGFARNPAIDIGNRPSRLLVTKSGQLPRTPFLALHLDQPLLLVADYAPNGTRMAPVSHSPFACPRLPTFRAT